MLASAIMSENKVHLSPLLTVFGSAKTLILSLLGSRCTRAEYLLDAFMARIGGNRATLPMRAGS